MGGQTAINLGAYSGMMESFRGVSKTPVLYNIPCVFLSASESLFYVLMNHLHWEGHI